MMNKIFLLFVFFVMYLLPCANAQDEFVPREKKTVLVDRITCADGVDSKYADALRGNIFDVFNRRTILIDALKEKSVQNMELKRRADGDLILNDEGNLEQLKSFSTLGAEYVISGKVLGVSTVRKESIVKVDVKDSKGVPVKDPKYSWQTLKKDSVVVSYDCNISYYLELMKVSDGTLVAGSTYNDVKNAKTEADAVKDAMSRLGGSSARAILSRTFPLIGTILEVASEKKGRALEVYINIGREHGISWASTFNVRVVRNIAGRTAYTPIGEIKVIEIEGKDISRCSVPKKYGEAILTAMRKAETLVVSSF